MGETPYETLERLTWAGAARRFPEGIEEKTREQIVYELDLVTAEAIRTLFPDGAPDHHACPLRAQDPLPGRGSAANSVICYCLEVTEVNPKKSVLSIASCRRTATSHPISTSIFEHDRRARKSSSTSTSAMERNTPD